MFQRTNNAVFDFDVTGEEVTSSKGETSWFIKMSAFRDVVPCSLIDTDGSFRSLLLISYHPDDGSKKPFRNMSIEKIMQQPLLELQQKPS
jgi:hypothetical protein